MDELLYWNTDTLAYCEDIYTDAYCIDWDTDASESSDDDSSDE